MRVHQIYRGDAIGDGRCTFHGIHRCLSIIIFKIGYLRSSPMSEMHIESDR
jgi:hypothetical protein